MDFPILLDSKSAEPLFIQLSKALKERIVSGGLAPGVALPPSRVLADSLDVSRGTVVKAYDDLIAQGYLESLTGSSTFVSKRGQLDRETQSEVEWKRNVETDGNFKLSLEARKLMEMSLSEGTAGFQPELNYGAPPAEMLPLPQWKEILTAQCRRQQPHHFDCTPETLGSYKLRVEIATHLTRSKGLNCQPEQVIVFPGPQRALANVAKILIDAGDTVAVEDPGFGGGRDTFSDRGAKLIPIPIDQDGILVERLEALNEPVKVVYVTPSCHDPTGAIMSLERRQALLEWASRRGAIIVEDGWDSDYTYSTAPIPSLQGLDRENRVIYLYSFWKVLYPLTTVGCAVVPLSLVPIFDRVKFLTERQSPILEHYALAEFLRTGALARHVKKTKVQYERRRKALVEAFYRLFKTDVEIPRQSAGLHLCIRFAPALLRAGLLKAAEEAGLKLVSTKAYYSGSGRNDEYLTPFADITAEEITQRTEVLARLMKIPSREV
ncbi:MAG: PLP-dependent aminotransferase family protein [Candidatus Melainabacteria bacterium]|nr:PLP-dependent aminotransferase family protein [Candidatus Melainabacteria bacterium]